MFAYILSSLSTCPHKSLQAQCSVPATPWCVSGLVYKLLHQLPLFLTACCSNACSSHLQVRYCRIPCGLHFQEVEFQSLRKRAEIVKTKFIWAYIPATYLENIPQPLYSINWYSNISDRENKRTKTWVTASVVPARLHSFHAFKEGESRNVVGTSPCSSCLLLSLNRNTARFPISSEWPNLCFEY